MIILSKTFILFPTILGILHFYIMASSASAFHLHGGNDEEIELIASNEDANEALSSSPHMSTVTFKTYEEIMLNIPKDDSYKTTITFLYNGEILCLILIDERG